jgi:hypothetical protein
MSMDTPMTPTLRISSNFLSRKSPAKTPGRVPISRGMMTARPARSRAGCPLDHRAASVRTARSSRLVATTRARAVPRWRAMSNDSAN